MTEKKIVVTQDPSEPMPTEVLAQCIESISQGIRKLRSGRLNDKALILLITNAAPSYGGHYSSKKNVAAVHVRAVLSGIEQLEAEYLKPKKKQSR